ncbi:MAG: hypothetical protein HY747_02215 [Elusimicrobia bacterium]|nr:hypothetical protein [Elusimicrobiota bacterium]
MKFSSKSFLFWLTILSVLALGLQRFLTDDLWRQMADARWILENRLFPKENPFIYVSSPWTYVNNEWLSSINFYGAFSLAGDYGVLIVRLAVLIFIAGLWWWYLRKMGLDPVWSALMILSAVMLLRSRFPPRPEIWTDLFLALLAVKAPGLRRFPALVVTFSAWANMHGGFIFGLVFLAVEAFAAAFVFLIALWRAQKNSARRRRKLMSACGLRLITAAAACLINPYGWKIFEAPLMMPAAKLSYLFNIATEGRRQAVVTACVSVFLLISLAVILIEARNRFLRKSTIRDLALTAAFGLFAVKLNRAAPMFYIAAFPCLAKRLIPGLAAMSPCMLKIIRPAWIIVLIVLAGPSFIREAPLALQKPLSRKFTPEKAADFMESRRLKGKVFPSWHYGGYINWKLYPNLRSFFDNRYSGVPLVWRSQEALYRGPEHWRLFLNETQADYGLCDWVSEGVIQTFEHIFWLKGERSPYHLLFPRQEWALIYWDDRSLLFARKPTPFDEFKWSEPLDFDWMLKQVSENKIPGDEVRRELNLARRLSGDHPVLSAMRQAFERQEARRTGGAAGLKK